MADAATRLAQQTDGRRLRKALEAAKTERRHFEPLLADCHRLYLPHRRHFYDGSKGRDNAAEIYDETGAVALEEYASRLHAGITPNFTKFAVLQAGPDVHRDDRSVINADLEAITDVVFDELWESNFSQEVHESNLDAGISTGSLLIEEGNRNLLRATAIPMTELFLEAGPYDDIGGMYREREVRAELLPVLYPDGQFSTRTLDAIKSEQDKVIRIVDAIWTDHEAENGEGAFHAVFLPDGEENEVIRRKRMSGVGCNPYIGYRVGKAAGEVWGRGPAMNTLPATRTMNLTLEMILQNAAMSLIGMYHLDDDSIINVDTITLEPGAILPRMANTRGLERIETPGSEFRLSDILLEDQRMKIRRGLFNDMLSDPNKTPATALEVAERMADLAHRMAAAFGRLHFELIRPLMMRMVWLGEKRRLFEMPTLKGQRVKVHAISPLALAQGQRDIQNLVQYHQVSTAMFGPQFASAQYEEPEALTYLRERLNVSEKLFAEPNAVIQKVATMFAGQAAGLPTGGAPPGPIQQ